MPLVEATLRGISSTLLTYGGDSSGKTYSLFGGEKDHEKGIILRALEQFIEQRGTCELSVSFYEVTSQDQLFDLLQKGRVGEVGVGGNLRGVSCGSRRFGRLTPLVLNLLDNVCRNRLDTKTCH